LFPSYFYLSVPISFYRSGMIFPFYKFRIGNELILALLEHLDERVETLQHLSTRVIPDNERHLKLRMLLQFEEFPRVKIRHEIAVVIQHATYHHVI